MKRILIALSSFALCGVALFGQEQAQQPQVINIHVARTIQAVNYRARGSTHIDFRGTALLPQAKGEAKIDSKAANVSIEAKFENLSPATQFGSVYLTYVLWAISPEGRANNLGQLTLDGSRSKVKVTTRLQTFGLIVTAEPYFSVSVPSEEVVLENMATSETQGKVDVVEAKYELLQRGRYNNANLPPLSASSDVSLELLQARNAMRIAQWRRADKYAPESWAKAQDALTRAEDFQTRKQRKSVATVAREAVQGFEDAITISLKRQDDERLAQEREASSQREAHARAEREAESQRRADAEKQKLQSDVNAARDAQARAEAEKGQAEAERQKAEADKEKAEAERQKAEAQANQQQALDQAEQARQAALRSEQEQQRLRATLLEQFNRILETRDTVRGLVVNLGDVLFTTAKYDLRPEARERLAKLAGIVLAHPGLNLAVEGHTDNVGSDTYNQTLSEQRAASVRAYLIAQGLDPNSITTAGYGKGQPVADNSTATGRQKNRRVEIVVSGEVIGVKIGTKPAGNQQ